MRWRVRHSDQSDNFPPPWKNQTLAYFYLFLTSGAFKNWKLLLRRVSMRAANLTLERHLKFFLSFNVDESSG